MWIKKFISLTLLLGCTIAAKAQNNKSAFDSINSDFKADQNVIEVTPVSSDSNPDKIDTTTLSQLESIKEQLRGLRGDIEKLQFENAKLNEKLTKLAADTELRFSELNKNRPIQQTESTVEPLIKSTNPTPPIENKENAIKPESLVENLPPQTNKDLANDKKSESMQKHYQEAYSLIKNKDYKAARTNLEKFVSDYPNTELTGNAYYWLGEICYLQSEYNKAAVYYLKGYQSNAKGSRAPDNLLKLAKLLAKLEKKQEACTTLNKLKKEFPTASSSIQKQMQEEGNKLKCS